MKKITATLVFLIYNLGFCQYPILSTTSLANPLQDYKITKKGNYAQDVNNERNQYVGTWKYEENGITFILKIAKLDQNLTKIMNNNFCLNYIYNDIVVFKYQLIKNGVVLNDNLNENLLLSPESQGIKFGSNTYLTGRILDVTRNVIVSLNITKLNTVPEKIKFSLHTGIYTLLNPKSFYNDGENLFNIPTDEIEMVKLF